MNSSRRSLREEGIDILLGILRKQNIGVDDSILEYLVKMNNLR